MFGAAVPPPDNPTIIHPSPTAILAILTLLRTARLGAGSRTFVSSSTKSVRLTNLKASTFGSRAAFSTSKMVAAKIDGNAIAKKIRERISDEIKAKQLANPRFKPSLTIVQGMRCDVLTDREGIDS